MREKTQLVDDYQLLHDQGSQFEVSKVRIISIISSSSIGELQKPPIRMYRIMQANYSEVRIGNFYLCMPYFYRTDADFLSRIFSFLFLPLEIGIKRNKSRKSVHHLAKEIQKIVPQLPVLVKKEFSWAFFLSFSENSKFE